jgi:hypothetical protein
MTKARARRLTRRERQRKKVGRPVGSTVPLERDRQRHQIAIWNGFRMCGYGPTVSSYWAAVATSDEPIQPEDLDGLLTVANTAIPRTASTLTEHLEALIRKAKRRTAEQADDFWLAASSLAIKAMIHAARIGNTEAFAHMVDALVEIGDWHDVVARLVERVIAASKSNVPPYEGELAPRGKALLDRLRSTIKQKPK